MTRILIVTEHNWPEGGGGTLATYLISRILVQEGFDVKVATGTERPKQSQDIEYIFRPYLRSGNKVGLWLNLATHRKTDSLRKMIEKTDIVYIPRYCYPIIPLAKSCGKKVIVHFHDYQPISHNANVMHSHVNKPRRNLNSVGRSIEYEMAEYGSIPRAMMSTFFLPFNGLARHWLAGADEVICVSKGQAAIMGKYLHKKPKVIYNPLPEVPFTRKKLDTPHFLYIGGTSSIKGMNTFVEASKELLRRHENARFMVTKGDRSSWKKALGGVSEESYQVLGFVQHEKMSSLHASALGLVFPSVSEEPLPYAVAEAMLHGTIPIASRVGGVPEIVEGSFAEKMLFSPGDSGQLVEKMEAVLEMSKGEICNLAPELRRNVMEKFDDEVIRRKLIRLFQDGESAGFER